MSTTTIAPRMNLAELSPEAYQAIIALGAAGAEHLDKRLAELVKLRVSQVNGCAFCLDLHARILRALGEDQLRLDVLPAWREAALFDERERAALALAEAVTRVSDGVEDGVWDAAATVFEERELAALLTTCITINAWNRVAIPTRMQPTGDYVPSS